MQWLAEESPRGQGKEEGMAEGGHQGRQPVAAMERRKKEQPWLLDRGRKGGVSGLKNRSRKGESGEGAEDRFGSKKNHA